MKNMQEVISQEFEKERLEYLRKAMIASRNIKVYLNEIDVRDKAFDDLLKNVFCENDYEYVQALIRGEEPKTKPIECDKINVFKPYIAQIFMNNRAIENYKSLFGGLSKLCDDEFLNEIVNRKLK